MSPGILSLQPTIIIGKATTQQPHLPSAETLPMAPLLDVEKVRKAHGCNCSTFSVTNDMLVNLKGGKESQVDGKSPYFIWFKKKNFLVRFLAPLVSK